MTTIVKLEILAMSILLSAIAVSISYGSDLRLAYVDLPGFTQYQDNLATYGYKSCLEKIPNEQGKYSCKNFILTLNAENVGWDINATNKNKNGTKDSGLCQLNSQYHSAFINSEDFKEPNKQIDYCLGVWLDAKKKGKMPWYGNAYIHKRDKGIKFFDPPLSDNIAKPKLKLTGRICKLLYRTKEEGETIQLDDTLGKFIGRFQNLSIGTKVFSCKEA